MHRVTVRSWILVACVYFSLPATSVLGQLAVFRRGEINGDNVVNVSPLISPRRKTGKGWKERMPGETTPPEFEQSVNHNPLAEDCMMDE